MLRASEADTSRSHSAAILTAMSFAGVALLYLVAAHTGAGRTLDRRAAPRPSEYLDPWPTAVRIFDAFDSRRVVLATAAVVAVALARRRPRLAAVAAVMVLGPAASAYVLKRVLRHLEGNGLGFAPSYPSAHATAALALGLALVVVLGPRLRPVSAVLAAGAAAVMGTSAVTIHAHRASDVLGAFLLATGWGAAVSLARRLPRVDREWRADAGGSRLVGLALTGAGLTAMLAAAPAGLAARAADDRINAALLGAWILVAGAAALAVGAYLRAAHPPG